VNIYPNVNEEEGRGWGVHLNRPSIGRVRFGRWEGGLIIL
jgi:hypothetical protein